MPDDTTTFLAGGAGLDTVDGLVDCPELLVSGNLLDDPAFHRFKHSEVLDQVKEVLLVEQTGNKNLLGSWLALYMLPHASATFW